jgi:hypothetical protein
MFYINYTKQYIKEFPDKIKYCLKNDAFESLYQYPVEYIICNIGVIALLAIAILTLPIWLSVLILMWLYKILKTFIIGALDQNS